MLLQKYKPRNNSLRDKIILKLEKYSKFKRLFLRLRKQNGRNYTGRITMKYKGGGIFYKYRKIDFFSYKYNFKYNCIGFDKSLYSSALLSLMKSTLNTYKYIISPTNLVLGKEIKTTFSFNNSIDSLGDSIPIGWIPNNTLIYNLETKPFNGSKLIRSAGSYGKIIAHSKNTVKVLLPSKKIIKFSKYCLAQIGRVSNIFHKFQNYGKAGYNINLNKRPRVNGENMNPVDHPNGGRTSGGKPTKNFWGRVIK
jgi:large subunit ribosomal protein L2